MSRPFGGMPTCWDPDAGPSSRVAVVVPGSGYSPAHPLLEFARQSLVAHGWSVQQIWWDEPEDDLTTDRRAAWVCDQVRETLGGLSDRPVERALLVGKSLGTMSAPVAAEYRLDAIWMTPLFEHEPTIRAIATNAESGARQLLVGGLADPSWDPVRAGDLDCEVLELPDATHFMHVPGDAVRSAQLHVEVAQAVETFLTGLDSRGELLRNFSWLLDGRLAGLAHPGQGGRLGPALDALRAEGVTALVSLDEAGISTDVANDHGLGYRHIPVTDFEPPSLAQADAFVAFVDGQLAEGGRVAAHCQAGIGRTGTMLAAYLIAHGATVDQALDRLQERRAYSVESDTQKRFLAEYAGHRATLAG